MSDAIKKKSIRLPFNSNAIKLLAALFMLIDHIGFFLFPNIAIFRIIGRLAMPIYAYMISEGCKYTKNKWMYLASLFTLGTLCQIVFYFTSHTFDMGILITYSFSICLIFAMQHVKKILFSPVTNIGIKIFAVSAYAFAILFMYVITLHLKIEYGFFGCMLAVITSIPDLSNVNLNNEQKQKAKYFDNKYVKILFFAIGLVLISIFEPFIKDPFGNIQFYSLFSIVFILLYNEQKGKRKMKYFFYIFYPVHQAILEVITWII